MGSECLRGKSDLKDRVRKALSFDRNLTPDIIFCHLNGASNDPQGFVDRLKASKIDYPYESVSRAIRKERELSDGLKDVKYFERQLEAKYVATNIVKDDSMNDYHVKQGSIL